MAMEKAKGRSKGCWGK